MWFSKTKTHPKIIKVLSIKTPKTMKHVVIKSGKDALKVSIRISDEKAPSNSTLTVIIKWPYKVRILNICTISSPFVSFMLAIDSLKYK